MSLSDSFSVFPQADGYLPYMLLFVSDPNPTIPREPRGHDADLDASDPQTTAAGLAHSIVCYLKEPAVALRQFSGPQRPPPTGLTARLYGTKNLYSAMIRATAAYNIENGSLYYLAMLTFVGVFLLYASEVFVYKTARMRESSIPMVQTAGILLWMYIQRSWYTS